MLKMRYSTASAPKPSSSFTDNPDNYNRRLVKEMDIWNLLIAKTSLSKVFLVENICGYRLLVMPYLFPLLDVLKSVEECGITGQERVV